MRDGVQRDLGVHRRLVGIVDAGEALDLAAAGLGVHSLGVALLAHLERRVDEHLDELIGAHHVAHIVAGRPVRADGGADDHAAVADDLRRHEADAADVDVPVFLAETQPLGEVRAHDVAVEHRHLPAVLEEELGQHLGRGRFAGAAQAGEPDADALLVPRRVGFGQDLGHFRPGEPLGQQSAAVQVLLAHLRARDDGRAPAGGPW